MAIDSQCCQTTTSSVVLTTYRIRSSECRVVVRFCVGHSDDEIIETVICNFENRLRDISEQ